jgi:hypothetical protein
MPSTLAFLLPDTPGANLAVRDDETGLFSACGFATVGDSVLRQRRRQGRPSTLVRLALEGATGGAPQRERQLFARLLQRVFDGSDLLCHRGRGRFVVLSGWSGDAVARPLRALRQAACGRRHGWLTHLATVRAVEPMEDDLALLLHETETVDLH